MDDAAPAPAAGSARAAPCRAFQDLMPWRVQDILLVSSLYDAFTLQEDGRLNELILSEFLDLDLHHTPGHHPRLERRRGAGAGPRAAALQPHRHHHPDRRHGRDRAGARGARAPGSTCRSWCWPTTTRELKRLRRRADDRRASSAASCGRATPASCWRSSSTIEDQRNVAHDTAHDRACASSCWSRTTSATTRSFLPVIYTEIIRQSRAADQRGHQPLAQAGAHARAAQDPARARPTRRPGSASSRYRDHLLASSPTSSSRARRELAARGRLRAGPHGARSACPTCPILLQSSRARVRRAAPRRWARPSCSRTRDAMLHDLRRVHGRALRLRRLRLPPARRHARWTAPRDLKTLEAKLRTVPGGEHRLPRRAQPLLATGSRRAPSSRSPTGCARGRSRGLPDARGAAPRPDRRRSPTTGASRPRRWSATSTARRFDPTAPFFLRIGGGSLGGKARGLAFVRRLLQPPRRRRPLPGRAHRRARRRWCSAPTSSTASSSENDLLDLRPALRATTTEIRAALPRRAAARPTCSDDLARVPRRACAARWRCAPRACSRTRSTSPSPASTRPTCCRTTTPTREVRLRRAAATPIQLVYASTFSRHAQGYLRGHALPARGGEDGGHHPAGGRARRTATASTPTSPGVARSYNFYPHAAAASRRTASPRWRSAWAARVVEGEQLPALLPALPAAPAAVLARSKDMRRELAARVLGARARTRAAARDPERELRETRFELRRWPSADGTLARGRLDLLARERRGLRRALAARRAPRHLRAASSSTGVFPLAEILELLLELGERGHEPRRSRSSSRCALDAPRRASRTSSASCRCARSCWRARRRGARARRRRPRRRWSAASAKRARATAAWTDLRDVVVVDFHRFDRAQQPRRPPREVGALQRRAARARARPTC